METELETEYTRRIRNTALKEMIELALEIKTKNNEMIELLLEFEAHY